MLTRSIKARWLASNTPVVPELPNPGNLNGNIELPLDWAGSVPCGRGVPVGAGTVAAFGFGAGTGTGCAHAAGASSKVRPISRAVRRIMFSQDDLLEESSCSRFLA